MIAKIYFLNLFVIYEFIIRYLTIIYSIDINNLEIFISYIMNKNIPKRKVYSQFLLL